MDNNIYNSNNEEEKLTEVLNKMLPKSDYFMSLDSSIKNLSVNVNDRIKEKRERRKLLKRRFIRFSPVFAASLCIVLWVILKDDTHTAAIVSQQAKSQAIEAATLTTDEFNGIVHDEISVVLDEIEDFDDPVLLFDSMTSSDVNTTIDELTESI